MRWFGSCFGQAAGFALMVLFFSVAFTPLPNVLARRLVVPSRAETAEAIVVLGGGLTDSRTLSLVSLGRTIQGIRLYRQGLAPTIIFAGGEAGQHAAEGMVMASLAVELGVPDGAIWIETESNDTWTEALEVARLAQPRGVRRILLVTDALHMKRASSAFERAGFQVLAVLGETGLIDAQDPGARLILMRQLGIEAFARLYYRVRSRL